MEKFLEALDEVKESFGSKIEEVYRNLALKKLLLEEIKKKTAEISIKRIVEVPYSTRVWDYTCHRAIPATRYKDEVKTTKIIRWKNLEDKVIAIEHNLDSQKMERLACIRIIEIPYTTKDGEKVLERRAEENFIIRVKFFPPSFEGRGHCLMDIYEVGRKNDYGKKLIQELFEEVLVIQEQETDLAKIEKIKKKEKIEEIEEEEKSPWWLDFEPYKIVRYKVL